MESCKQNITLNTTQSDREFLQQMLLELQKFAHEQCPGVAFAKVAHTIKKLKGRPLLQQEIYAQAHKIYGCELLEVNIRGKKKDYEVFDMANPDQDLLMSSDFVDAGQDANADASSFYGDGPTQEDETQTRKDQEARNQPSDDDI